jgi:hypothetical protein
MNVLKFKKKSWLLNSSSRQFFPVDFKNAQSETQAFKNLLGHLWVIMDFKSVFSLTVVGQMKKHSFCFPALHVNNVGVFS